MYPWIAVELVPRLRYTMIEINHRKWMRDIGIKNRQAKSSQDAVIRKVELRLERAYENRFNN